MGPFKCPDCGIWWAGYEHRCKPQEVSTSGNITFYPYCTQCGNYHPVTTGGCPNNRTITIDTSKVWYGNDFSKTLSSSSQVM